MDLLVQLRNGRLLAATHCCVGRNMAREIFLQPVPYCVHLGFECRFSRVLAGPFLLDRLEALQLIVKLRQLRQRT